MNRPAPHADQIFKRDATQTFTAEEGCYTLRALNGNVEITIDQLRRDRGALRGEVRVRCGFAGARTFGADGTTLFTTEINLLYNSHKTALAGDCQRRANTPREVRWDDLIEDCIQRVIEAERDGGERVWIHEVPRTTLDERTISVHGMPIYLDHQQILFGQSMTGKSFLASAIIGALGRAGLRTLLLDWEMDKHEHRRRYDALGLAPTFAYMRPDRPLVAIVDMVKRRVLEDRIDFVMVDSIVHACDGPPEDAVVAKRVGDALKRIGRGSLSIAHTRAEDEKTERKPQQQRPFGSVVWHTNTGAAWFLKRVNADTDKTRISVGVYNTKWRLEGCVPPFGLTTDLTLRPDGSVDHVEMRRTNIADEPELAATLPMPMRLRAALAHGPRPFHELADEMGAVTDSQVEHVRKTLNRLSKGDRPKFTLVTKTPDGQHKWALAEHDR